MNKRKYAEDAPDRSPTLHPDDAARIISAPSHPRKSRVVLASRTEGRAPSTFMEELLTDEK